MSNFENQSKSETASLWEGKIESPELREALERLTYVEQRAIFLRFWEFQTIEEISEQLGFDWDQADQCIEKSLKVLRKLIPTRPNKPAAISAA